MEYIGKIEINIIAEHIIEIAGSSVNSFNNQFFKANAKRMLSILIDFYNTYEGVAEEKKNAFCDYRENLLEDLNFILKNEISDFPSLHEFLYSKIDIRHTEKTLEFREVKYKNSEYYAIYKDYAERNFSAIDKKTVIKIEWIFYIENLTINSLRDKLKGISSKEIIEVKWVWN